GAIRRRPRVPGRLLHRHSLPQIVVDGALVALAYVLAFQLRFDRGVKGPYLTLFHRTLPGALGLSLGAFLGFRLYNKWWRYSTLRDLLAVGQGVVLATVG